VKDRLHKEKRAESSGFRGRFLLGAAGAAASSADAASGVGPSLALNLRTEGEGQ
jgi:hypothetical protein